MRARGLRVMVMGLFNILGFERFRVMGFRVMGWGFLTFWGLKD